MREAIRRPPGGVLDIENKQESKQDLSKSAGSFLS